MSFSATTNVLCFMLFNEWCQHGKAYILFRCDLWLEKELEGDYHVKTVNNDYSYNTL